jgi:hypothetical protein
MRTDGHTELIRAAVAPATAAHGTPGTAGRHGTAVPGDDGDPRTRFARPSARRLTVVELRKTVDTRAGRWLLIAAGLLAAAVGVARGLTGDAADRTFAGALELTVLPLGVLLPVLGILLMTGEWSQRTALTTYALVPDRLRITLAKVRAGLVIGLAAAAASVAAAALGNAVGILAGDADGSWALSASDVGQIVLDQELNLLMGLGFGLLLVSPALAIVAFFALPTVFALLDEMLSSLDGVTGWIAPNEAFDPLTTMSASGGDWPRILVCAVLWIGAPLALGALRTQRREVK